MSPGGVVQRALAWRRGRVARAGAALADALRALTVWSPCVDAKYSPSAEKARAIVDLAVSGSGM